MPNGTDETMAPIQGLDGSGARDARPAPPALALDKVCRRVGRKQILTDVSLSVAPGEIVSVIGPSGAGKSTMLRCANQLEPITGGTIAFQGEVVAHGVDKPKRNGWRRNRELAQYRRSVGLVFQNFQLFPHLTCLQNITLAQVHSLGRSKAEARERAMELLALVGLDHVEKQYPATMSGGEQQRAAIARALALDPAMLLFDEPTSAIDPERRRDVLNVLRRLAGTGMTMLVVTHEIHFAREVAERMIFMADGRVVEDGTPDTLLHHPKDERTQRFIEAVTYDRGDPRD